MSFEASCHCGAVAITVDADLPDAAMSCDCSHCRRKGFLLAFFPAAKVTVTGEDALTDYLFNKHRITHRFCATCGVQVFGEGNGPDGTPTNAVNLRCVPGLDLDTLTVTKVNGAAA